jgi:hypothetical protein
MLLVGWVASSPAACSRLSLRSYLFYTPAGVAIGGVLLLLADEKPGAVQLQNGGANLHTAFPLVREPHYCASRSEVNFKTDDRERRGLFPKLLKNFRYGVERNLLLQLFLIWSINLSISRNVETAHQWPCREQLKGTYWGSFAIVCESPERGMDKTNRTGSSTAAATSCQGLAFNRRRVLQRTGKPAPALLAVIIVQLLSVRIFQVAVWVPHR